MTSSKRVSLFDLIEIFKNYRKRILYPTGIAFVAITIYIFFIADPIYLSSATVKTSAKVSGIASLLGGAGLQEMGGLEELTGGGMMGRELSLYENILLSRRCVEDVIVKFKLNDDWDFKYMQDAIKYFREKVLEIKKDKIAGTMDIGVYDKNPQRAKEIAEYLIEKLNTINIELNVQNAKNNREFIEARYKTARDDLKRAEDSLRHFQDIYGIAPDVITKLVAQTEVQLESEIASEEVKLDLLKKIISPDQNEVKLQEEKIALLKKQLNDVKNAPDIDNSLLRLKGKPEVVINYLRLVREVEIQNKILQFLLPVYEQAKIEEKKEMPSVLVLDQPSLPEYKVKPKRVLIISIVTILVFAMSYLFSFVYHQVKNVKSIS
ncbi:MAG: GNVR domain-containing protein [Ignavibacteria bacterium]